MGGAIAERLKLMGYLKGEVVGTPVRYDTNPSHGVTARLSHEVENADFRLMGCALDTFFGWTIPTTGLDGANRIGL